MSPTTLTTLTTLAVSTSLLLAAVALPSDAHACGVPACFEGYFDYDQKMVPAELDAFVWHPGDHHQFEDEVQETDAVLEELQTGTQIPIELDVNPPGYGSYLVRPKSPLSPGTAYRFSGLDLCEYDEDTPRQTWRREAVFATACEPQGLPTKLGELRAGPNFSGTLGVDTTAGSCAIVAEASQTRIWLEPDEEAVGWMPVMHFWTKIDDFGWFPSYHLHDSSAEGASWQGRGRDLLYALCEDPPDEPTYNLEAGRSYQVRMLARIPGTDIEFETEPIQITLDCDAPAAEEADEGYPHPEHDGWPETGCDVSLDPDESSDDVGNADAGPDTGGDAGSDASAEEDADAHSDAEDDANGGPTRIDDGPVVTTDGCSCTTSGTPAPGAAVYLLLIAFGLGALRHRRPTQISA